MRSHPRSLVAAVCGVVLAVTVPAAWAADLTGTDGDDTIAGTAEDDTVFSLAGNDTVLAGPGNDAVFGAQGDDRLVGDRGNDLLNGGGGADVLEGGFGRDTLRLRGADRAYGGPQVDFFTWSQGAVEVHGGPGEDRVHGGGRGDQQIYGEGGGDLLRLDSPVGTRTVVLAGGGDDQVVVDVDPAFPGAVALIAGGDGDDDIFGGARRVRGGPGDDEIYTASPGRVDCGPGVDLLGALLRDVVVGSDCEDVTFYLPVREGEVFRGTSYDDYVYDGPGDETIRTLEGDDYVQDLDGSDIVDLGPGDDQFASNGTTGVDTITCGAGDDTVLVQPTDVVADDCEHVTLL